MNVKNIDIAEIGKLETTPEGYLRGQVVVTRTGVFKYLRPNGKIILQKREPAAVANAESLETLTLKPVTIGHPPVWLTAENSKKYQVGMTGETVEFDPTTGNLTATIVITDESGINAVKNGAKQLSLGYDLTLTSEEGEYNGEKYTHRVDNIKYNHLAIVKNARAGAVTTIQADSSDEFLYQTEPIELIEPIEKPNSRGDAMKSITIDGVTHQVDDTIALYVATLTQNADATTGKVDELEKEKSNLKGQVDAAKAELKTLKEKNTDTVDQEQKLADKIRLISTVSKTTNTDAADLVGKTTRELKVVVIKNADSKFEDKSEFDENYIAGRYEAVLSMTETHLSSNTDEQAANFEQRNKLQNIDEYDVDAAYKRQVERLINPGKED